MQLNKSIVYLNKNQFQDLLNILNVKFMYILMLRKICTNIKLIASEFLYNEIWEKGLRKGYIKQRKSL